MGASFSRRAVDQADVGHVGATEAGERCRQALEQRLGEPARVQADLQGGAFDPILGGGDLGGRQRREDAADRELDRCDHLATADDGDPASRGDHRVGGHRHVVGVPAEDDEVVRVVGERRGHGAGPVTPPGEHGGDRGGGGPAVAMDGDLQDVALGHAGDAVVHLDVGLAPHRHRAADDGPEPVGAVGEPGQVEEHVVTGHAVEAHRVEGREARPLHHRHDHLPGVGDVASVGVDVVDDDLIEVGQDDQVGPAAGADHTEVGAPESEGGVVRAEADGPHGVHAGGDEAAEEVVEPSVGEQGQGEEVVGGEDQVHGQLGEGAQLLHQAGDEAFDHPSELHGHPRPELLHDVAVGEDLVVALRCRRRGSPAARDR